MAEDKPSSRLSRLINGDDRTNRLILTLEPTVFNNGIHALISDSNSGLVLGDGLSHLTKLLDLDAYDTNGDWTPAPEDIGLSTDLVQPFVFHIQDYLQDNYSNVLNYITSGKGQTAYDKCLAFVNKCHPYIYLSYDLYYNNTKTPHEPLVEPLSTENFSKDITGKLLYNYNLDIGDKDKADLYIHQFLLVLQPPVNIQAVGSAVEASMRINNEEDDNDSSN